MSIAFVENANITAGRDIFVNDAVLHSVMRAGHHVTVEGKRGFITGGSVGAGASIRAKILGNNFYVQTNINVGIDPNLKHKYDNLLKEYQAADKQLTQVRLALETLKKQPLMSLSERRREQLAELTHVQFPLATKIKRMKDELEEMREELEQMKNGSVEALDTIFPGVNIIISGVKKTVDSELRRAKLQVLEGEVVTGIL